MPRRKDLSRWRRTAPQPLLCRLGQPDRRTGRWFGQLDGDVATCASSDRRTTRVCAYDRAGLGFSDAATRPSDLRNIVDDLHRLVEAAPIATPFVYVGHSLAGAIGLLYVATYPEDIAGAVLVEPAFAGEVAALQAPLPPESAMRSPTFVPSGHRFRRRLSGARPRGRARYLRRRGARLRRYQRRPGRPDAALRRANAQLDPSPRLGGARVGARELHAGG